MKDWFIYIIRCGDGTLYTGITNDITRRFDEHRAGKGAKYLKGRGPLKLVYKTVAGSRSDALKLEAKIKKMKKNDKELMILESKQSV